MTGVLERLTGVPLPPLVPGSDAWLKTMSASKISAVLGLNPWESRFSLYARMAGWVLDEQTDAHRRGHFLEPGVLAWFASQHPDWTINPGGSWAHPDHPLYTAAPDAIAATDDGLLVPVDAKTDAGDLHEWGAPGTDEVPPHYRAQIMWQCGVLGAPRGHLALLSPYLSFAEYVITFDPNEFAYLCTQGQAFLDTLPDGLNPQRPDLDEHGATYETVRKLHPEIDTEGVALLTDDVALGYTLTYDALAAAKAAHTKAKAVLLDVMGDARRAYLDDQQIAMRIPSQGGAVALKRTPSKKSRKAAAS